MRERRTVEIICTACGKESLLVRKPVYEGLKKAGETLHCAACGHRFTSEEDVPFKEQERRALFTEADRSHTPRVFEENEHRRLCRYCAHYIVNPFTQWCSVHRKEVEATDTCDRFEEAKEEKPGI
jgi:DNA-directed RNA polymerase subunit RPC12/RpoP